MVESRVCGGGGGSFGCRPASAWRQKQAGGVPRPSAQLLPRSPGPRSAARAPSQAPELPGRHFVAANIGAHDVRLFSQERNAHFLTRRAGGAAGGPPATTFFPGMPEDGLLVPRPDPPSAKIWGRGEEGAWRWLGTPLSLIRDHLRPPSIPSAAAPLTTKNSSTPSRACPASTTPQSHAPSSSSALCLTRHCGSRLRGPEPRQPSRPSCTNPCPVHATTQAHRSALTRTRCRSWACPRLLKIRRRISPSAGSRRVSAAHAPSSRTSVGRFRLCLA